MKKKKKSVEERTLTQPLILIIFLSVLEPILIVLGMLPPIFSYSLGNLLFAFLELIIIIQLAYSRSDEGIKESVINGAVLGFTMASILVASGLIGSNYFEKPVLGISAVTQLSRLQILGLLILGNTILFALISALVTGLAKKFKR
ncbi:hypothetical protein H0N98_01940 [Candidatus Micrarchaeota archaeon]|nr:hypothetical protein [Candidatus Micrarchaeota archaeon]